MGDNESGGRPHANEDRNGIGRNPDPAGMVRDDDMNAPGPRDRRGAELRNEQGDHEPRHGVTHRAGPLAPLAQSDDDGSQRNC